MHKDNLENFPALVHLMTVWKSVFINKQLLLYYIKRKGDQIHFQPLPERGSVLFVEVCISFPDSLDFRQLAALQTEPRTPKIEKLC